MVHAIYNMRYGLGALSNIIYRTHYHFLSLPFDLTACNMLESIRMRCHQKKSYLGQGKSAVEKEGKESISRVRVAFLTAFSHAFVSFPILITLVFSHKQLLSTSHGSQQQYCTRGHTDATTRLDYERPGDSFAYEHMVQFMSHLHKPEMIEAEGEGSCLYL